MSGFTITVDVRSTGDVISLDLRDGPSLVANVCVPIQIRESSEGAIDLILSALRAYILRRVME